MEQIYFDHSATTPLDPRVVEAMLPFYEANFGNPSSLHWAGQQAKQAIDEGRSQVAELFHAEPDEIVFTASGTEADNMVLMGVAAQYKPQDCHIITSSFEHPAILETCKYLEKLGYSISYLPVSPDGIVLAESLKQALRPNTRLVSVMAANNVVGTLQPIYELANITKEHGALFHTDAVQAVGKIPLYMDSLPVDFLSLVCAQIARAQRHRRVVHPPRRCHRTARAWRRAGTRHPLGHGKCGGDCRAWESRGNCRRRNDSRGKPPRSACAIGSSTDPVSNPECLSDRSSATNVCPVTSALVLRGRKAKPST